MVAVSLKKKKIKKQLRHHENTAPHRINNNGYSDVVFLAEPDDYWFNSHCYLLYLDGVLYASSSDGELVLGTCYDNVEDTLTYGGWTKVAEYSGG
mgnify:CR=1 FL=1